jgi:hypothetical protein
MDNATQRLQIQEKKIKEILKIIDFVLGMRS